MTQPKRRLTDIKFEHEGAHVALVFAAQGGPANGVTTLITKATSDISEKDIAQLLDLQKSQFKSDESRSLRRALEDSFSSGYEWLHLEDYSGDTVLFTSDTGMWEVGYTVTDDDKYVFEDKARGFGYEMVRVENDQIKLSNEAQEKLSTGEYVLLTKSLDNSETIARVDTALGEILKSKQKMNEEIQKAVAGKDAEIANLQADLAKALESLAKFEADKQELILKARETKAQEFVKEGAVDLVKSTASLDDAAFDAVIAALAIQKSAVAASGLMQELSDPNAVATQPVNTTAELIKSRHGNK